MSLILWLFLSFVTVVVASFTAVVTVKTNEHGVRCVVLADSSVRDIQSEGKGKAIPRQVEEGTCLPSASVEPYIYEEVTDVKA